MGAVRSHLQHRLLVIPERLQLDPQPIGEAVDVGVVAYHLHDVEDADIIDEPELVLNIGAGMKWIAPVNEDGVLEILLITGTIDASSEFEVMQRNLTMEYSGGQVVTIRAGQESPPIVMSNVRSVNHDISLATLSSTVTIHLTTVASMM